jgi:hypothetical protein
VFPPSRVNHAPESTVKWQIKDCQLHSLELDIGLTHLAGDIGQAGVDLRP